MNYQQTTMTSQLTMTTEFETMFKLFVNENYDLLIDLHEQFLTKNENISFSDLCKFMFHKSY